MRIRKPAPACPERKLHVSAVPRTYVLILLPMESASTTTLFDKGRKLGKVAAGEKVPVYSRTESDMVA